MTPSSRKQVHDALLELAERCEQATADEAMELIQEAGNLVLERGTEAWRDFNRYMHGFALLDAAMSLVPKDRDWFVERRRDGKFNAFVNGCGFLRQGIATPALALAAASLRARAESGK